MNGPGPPDCPACSDVHAKFVIDRPVEIARVELRRTATASAKAASPNTVHLTFLDAHLYTHDARAETPTGPEWEVAHLPLHAAGHRAPATRPDAVPHIDELGQQRLMEGRTRPRGE